MKLFRFGPAGQEKPGVLLRDGRRLDVSSFGRDYDEGFFADDGLNRLDAWLASHGDSAPTVPDDVRLGPPVCRPSKIICIGLNYIDHVRETGAETPTEPVLFFKATTALCGPDDHLQIPRGAQKVDWEVELMVVIGKRAKYVEQAHALEHVAGFMLHDDYSEREFQLERGGQWVKGKSCDSFAPIGPWFVPRDQIGDFRNLDMWLTVNGEMRQKSNTANMIFDVPQLVSYVSRFMTLLPGDMISTGTPHGVGLGFDPPIYLRVGDVVECGIDQLGRQRQQVASEGQE